jgi:hypothetical protein
MQRVLWPPANLLGIFQLLFDLAHSGRCRQEHPNNAHIALPRRTIWERVLVSGRRHGWGYVQP